MNLRYLIILISFIIKAEDINHILNQSIYNSDLDSVKFLLENNSFNSENLIASLEIAREMYALRQANLFFGRSAMTKNQGQPVSAIIAGLSCILLGMAVLPSSILSLAVLGIAKDKEPKILSVLFTSSLIGGSILSKKIYDACYVEQKSNEHYLKDALAIKQPLSSYFKEIRYEIKDSDEIDLPKY